MSNVAKLTWSNLKNIGEALYNVSGFENSIWLQCVRREFPDGELSTQIIRRGQEGLELPTESRFASKISFRFLVLDALKIALEKIVLHENFAIEYDGIVYEAKERVEVTSEYEQGMDLHNVLLTVKYDNEISRESIINDNVTIL